ncbi:hypothetical protein [Acidobacterium sp. S8]|uniref:hypothetical protein n=1 Tax=Acidobacterium sp. S8 TaxID=1641854 RepID=UPI00131B990B|nr:hypothetical protein [Acidobacterium sp. S8]
MYLWKYWRESRILFGISLLAIAVLTIAILRERLVMGGHPDGNVQFSGVWAVFLGIQIIPLCFIAWIFGSFGVGRDLGEHSGSFIFSRPQNRAWFIWRDWGFGLLQLLVIVICLNLAGWLQIHRVLAFMSDSTRDFVLSQNGYASIKMCTLIATLAAFLLAALVFSLTYFSTILIKNARGLFISAGVFLGYMVLSMVVKHYWPSVELPSLLLQPFTNTHQLGDGTVGHLGIAMAIRAVLVLLFPIAAQFVLERADI